MGPAHGYRHLSARLSATYLSSGDVASTGYSNQQGSQRLTGIGCERSCGLLGRICSFYQQRNTEHLHQAVQRESLTTCDMLLKAWLCVAACVVESNSGPS